MPLQMRAATKEDIPSIARISAAAFHPSTDPISRVIFPNGCESAQEWREARKAASFAWDRAVMKVVVDDELGDEVVGFSFWVAPVEDGKQDQEVDGAGSSAKGTPASPFPAEPELPAEVDEKAYKEMKSIVHADARDLFGPQGAIHVWQLGYIGVDPSHQRRGIGKMLLTWGIDQAAQQGKDCYMFATPSGKALYEAVGFVARKEVPVFGVPHYSMILRHEKQ